MAAQRPGERLAAGHVLAYGLDDLSRFGAGRVRGGAQRPRRLNRQRRQVPAECD